MGLILAGPAGGASARPSLPVATTLAQAQAILPWLGQSLNFSWTERAEDLLGPNRTLPWGRGCGAGERALWGWAAAQADRKVGSSRWEVVVPDEWRAEISEAATLWGQRCGEMNGPERKGGPRCYGSGSVGGEVGTPGTPGPAGDSPQEGEGCGQPGAGPGCLMLLLCTLGMVPPPSPPSSGASSPLGPGGKGRRR